MAPNPLRELEKIVTNRLFPSLFPSGSRAKTANDMGAEAANDIAAAAANGIGATTANGISATTANDIADTTANGIGAGFANGFGATTANGIGAATANGTGAATANSFGAATANIGSATANAIGAATASGIGAATANGIGDATANSIGSATANAIGAATASGIGAATANGIGAATANGRKAAPPRDPWADFTEEPHASRRKEMLAKYPQIKTLMGPDPNIVWQVGLLVGAQCAVAVWVAGQPWWVLLLATYVVGATLNHILAFAIHEIGHQLAFGYRRPAANKALGVFANLPVTFPLNIMFRKYHSSHHRNMGKYYQDLDRPRAYEEWFFRSPPRRLAWLLLHPALYALRHASVDVLPWCGADAASLAVQAAFDLCVMAVLGIKPVVYFTASTVVMMSLHPLAGRFLSEHLEYQAGNTTFSYYGPWNPLTFHVGLHTEHHDFPYVPGSRLHKVREIAKEYYATRPHHRSYLGLIWHFIARGNPHGLVVEPSGETPCETPRETTGETPGETPGETAGESLRRRIWGHISMDQNTGEPSIEKRQQQVAHEEANNNNNNHINYNIDNSNAIYEFNKTRSFGGIGAS